MLFLTLTFFIKSASSLPAFHVKYVPDGRSRCGAPFGRGFGGDTHLLSTGFARPLVLGGGEPRRHPSDRRVPGRHSAEEPKAPPNDLIPLLYKISFVRINQNLLYNIH